MRRLFLPLIALVLLIAIGFALGVAFSGRNAAPSQSVAPQVVTVPIIITATRDPNVTEVVRIVTTTPLPGSVGPLPTGILETDSTAVSVATLDPELLGADAALQETVTSLPENCIPYAIQDGDTPFGIAEVYGVSGFDIMEINGLTDETATQLQIGDVLIVPLEGCPLTAADVVGDQTEEATEEATAESTEESTAEVTITNTPSPTVVPTITLPPTAINAQIEIVRVISAGDITAEGVEIRNLGGVVNMTGWTLTDSDGNSFTFPEQRLFTNGMVTVYTRVGQNTPIALFWGQSEAVWSDEGDAIVLMNADGEAQASLRLP
jgi:Lamin Tail Domain/LysM domain